MPGWAGSETPGYSKPERLVKRVPAPGPNFGDPRLATACALARSGGASSMHRLRAAQVSGREHVREDRSTIAPIADGPAPKVAAAEAGRRSVGGLRIAANPPGLSEVREADNG